MSALHRQSEAGLHRGAMLSPVNSPPFHSHSAVNLNISAQAYSDLLRMMFSARLC